MASDGNERDAETFRGYLEGFRETGAALLSTGMNPVSVRVRTSQRLFGAASEPHSRILLCLTGGHRPAEYLPPLVSPTGEAVTVIATKAATRGPGSVQRVGGAAPDPPTDGGTAPPAGGELPTGRLQESEPLAALERAFLEAVERQRPASGSFEPNRLRVGVTSLLPLFSRVDTALVRTFCASVVDTVRANRGVVHFHLPVPDSAARHRELAGYVDARIELRDADGVEWRWHVPAGATTSATGWLEV
jgi:hypothetical protein